jgi:ATP-dependent DNA helicase RecG
MYRLVDRLDSVKGIGSKLAELFAEKNLYSVKDLLLFVPLRYEDRSTQKLISQLIPDELVTIQAEIKSFSNQYKGRRSIQRATIADSSGKLNVIWFNNPHLKDNVQKGVSYFFSGKLTDKGQMVQPTMEKISDDTIHTNRLIPLYSSVSTIQPGKLRRLLKHVIDNLKPIEDPLASDELLSLSDTFQHLHFPSEEKLTIKARERLAIEELLGLMRHSQTIKEQWQHDASAHRIEVEESFAIPDSIPFELTKAQRRSISEVLIDLNSDTPMNRLLLGDVGSGKTVVAGIAALHTIDHGYSAALVAPTQILAEQHMQTIKKLFPSLPIQLLTSKQKTIDISKPSFIIGTHSIINQLETIQPALIVYDEQHKFGVGQRSEVQQLPFHPHVLTMSATPIPRSLMLTIFSHLELSVIDELPAGRLPVKTWIVPEGKRTSSYDWMKDQIKKERSQALIVCPFIDASEHEAFGKVKAATEVYPEIKKTFNSFTTEMLHGRLSAKDKDRITKDLFSRKIDVLVTTPIVEVGVDLPAASIMVIESAERFGLASLHQLRGRVGRAGQQAYCLLFSNSKSADSKNRLKIFSETTDGMKLAEFDLQNRGAGDLFGTEQHGFEQLKFAQWTNVELIAKARQTFSKVSEIPDWEPLLKPVLNEEAIPLAN